MVGVPVPVRMPGALGQVTAPLWAPDNLSAALIREARLQWSPWETRGQEMGGGQRAESGRGRKPSCPPASPPTLARQITTRRPLGEEGRKAGSN